MLTRIATAVAVATCLAITTGGCVASGEVSGNEPPALEPVERDHQDDVQPPLPEPEPEQWEQPWTCGYSPTIDNDWHNDALCTNGVESQRPYLRPDDSFVTGDELAASAREYQDELNAGTGASTPGTSRLGKWTADPPKKPKKSGYGRWCDYSSLPTWAQEKKPASCD